VAIRFVFDEHLRGPLFRAVERHNALHRDPIDVVRVGDPPDLPLAADDAALLVWAEQEGRILVTSDKRTIPGFLAAHLAGGRRSPGILMLRRRWSVRDVVMALVLVTYASEDDEWQDGIHYIPEPNV
jgi:uncharacterized protein DUF5615